MADQQPSWLGKEGDAAPSSEPAAAPAVEETPDISVSDRSAEPAAAAASTVDESDLSKMILFMRIANMGLAIAMLTCSVSQCIIRGECPPNGYRVCTGGHTQSLGTAGRAGRHLFSTFTLPTII